MTTEPGADVLERFSPATRAWFSSSFTAPTVNFSLELACMLDLMKSPLLVCTHSLNNSNQYIHPY